jgi:hypothetical protein
MLLEQKSCHFIKDYLTGLLEKLNGFLESLKDNT